MKPRTGRLEDEYAYATECNLATLSGLMGRKRSPKCEIDRQTSICAHMLTVCRRLYLTIEWTSGPHHHYGRAAEILADDPTNIQWAKEIRSNVEITQALERFKESCR